MYSYRLASDAKRPAKLANAGPKTDDGELRPEERSSLPPERRSVTQNA